MRAGINFFDNAEGYEAGVSEALMGEALANLGWSRDSYIVSSKVFWGGSKPTQRGLSRKHVTDACHAALKRLQVEYLDLYFCHRPDIDTPIEETVRAMHDLVAQGKVLYWGTSEWTAQQITEAWGVARALNLTPPTMEQPQYNIFERHKVEGDYLPLYDLVGLGTTIWSPLASGVLTGKYSKGIPDDSRLNLPGYEWLKEIWQSEGGKAKLAKVDELAALARGDRHLHDASGAPVVPRQPACLDGDPRRLEALAARRQPRPRSTTATRSRPRSWPASTRSSATSRRPRSATDASAGRRRRRPRLTR